MEREETKAWILTVAAEVCLKLAEQGLRPPCHCDVFDDQYEGRVASFELGPDGKVTWWSWRGDTIVRARWPLKLNLSFAKDERRTVWVRPQSWQAA